MDDPLGGPMRLTLALMTAAALAASTSVNAQVCATIAVDDALSVDDQASALALVEATIEMRGLGQAGALDCDTILTVRHIVLGGAYHVIIEGPTGAYRETAETSRDLPDIYDGLIDLALNGSATMPAAAVPASELPADTAEAQELVPEGWHLDPNTGELVADPPAVESEQWEPRRSGPGRDFGYFRLGPGTIFADGAVRGGPAIGFGWRHYEGNLAVDVSVANTFALRDTASGFTTGILTMNFYYVTRPLAPTSAYLGGGLSWGIARVCVSFDEEFGDDECFRGDGLQGEIGGGVEILRHTSIRLTTHLGLSLPFGTTAPTNQWGDPRDGSSAYIPTGVATIGIGFGGRCLDCESPPDPTE